MTSAEVMSSYLRLMYFVFVSLFRSRRRLASEIVVLRHQVLVLKRKHRGRIKLNGLDRMILTWLSSAIPAVRSAIVIVQPGTLLRWHRKGFRAFWRWKSGTSVERPSVDPEIKGLIHRMAHENPLWGAPRIHGELLKLGLEVAQSTVSKYLRQHSRPSGQTWKTFIENHKDAVAAVDLFVVPTIGFKFLYGIAILHLKRRELVWTNATLHPTADWIAQQITEAFPWDQAPAPSGS
jgi:hypothetical protein